MEVLWTLKPAASEKIGGLKPTVLIRSDTVLRKVE